MPVSLCLLPAEVNRYGWLLELELGIEATLRFLENNPAASARAQVLLTTRQPSSPNLFVFLLFQVSVITYKGGNLDQ